MDKSKNLYGHLFALTANVMWGLMSPIGKSALQEFSPISVTTVSYTHLTLPTT